MLIAFVGPGRLSKRCSSAPAWRTSLRADFRSPCPDRPEAHQKRFGITGH